MPNDQPLWTHKENAIRNWVIVILGVFGGVIYFNMDRKREGADLQLKQQELITEQVDHRLRLATAPLEQRLKELDADLRKVSTRETEAKAKIAELEAEKSSSQLLVVKPVVEQTESIQDIREITLDTLFTNVGVSPASLSEIKVEVFEAVPSADTRDILTRTQTISNYRQALEQMNAFGSNTDPERRAQLEKTLEELREDCPHGRLFAIDPSSKDVQWKPLVGLTKKITLGVSLPSEASSFKRFTYLLTEYPEQHHRQWFRFVITVNPDHAKIRQQFDFVVSGLPLRSETRTVNMTRTTNSHRMRWAPDIPLLPAEPGDERREDSATKSQ